MTTPCFPVNEQARLRALHALRILDTAPQESFDRLTRLARRMFDVPIALVSLVDSDRQWFKSRQGIEVVETPRSVSLCAHAILGKGLMEVPDLLKDERFADNPMVTADPHLRFYAGHTLTLEDDLRLGTLCVADWRPRQLTTEDRDLLRDLAQMAQQEIESVQLATTDHLTGLSNRRGFELLGGHALAACRRRGLQALLLYFDLDGLKLVNDREGHAEGDRLLRDFGRALVAAFRDSDVVARLGGDEFAVLLGSYRQPDAAALARRLDEVICGLEGRGGAGAGGLRYSMGAVPYEPAQHAEIGVWLAQADQAMYAHKLRRRTHAASD